MRLLPFKEELRVQELRLSNLEGEQGKYTLVAPAAGRVENVVCRPGEWIGVGMEVIVLVVPRPGRATAYVTDRQVEAITLGAVAQLRPRERRGPALEGKVIAAGPRVEPVPQRLRFIPTVPQWGRLVTIQVNPDADLLPGELYDVRFAP